jgi:hypothetical protein
MSMILVHANGRPFGVFIARTPQDARDALANDAGYESEADMVEQLGQPSEMKTLDIDDIPGNAEQVWGGWIWTRRSGREYPWSRGRTREACERKVLEVVHRIGIDAALNEEE